MKKIYEKPVMLAERFVAENYCAGSCGDTGQKYLFECTSPSGRMYLYENSPATGPRPSSSTSHTYIGQYSPCGKKHEAPTQGDFNYGFIDRYPYNGREDEGEAAILYLEHGQRWNRWSHEYEDYISNGHATGNLNIEQWEVTKS